MDDKNRSDHLFEQLAAEEPPLNHMDTSPSATAPRAVLRSSTELWQQYLGSMMLLTALILTIAAGLVIFLSDDEESESSEAISTITSEKPTLDSSTRESPTQQPTHETNTSAFLPTIAFDEAAVSLLTPVPEATPSGAVIQRVNPPFTRRSGEVDGARNFAYYTVQTGDTLDKLISRFGLADRCTLVWSNERNKVSPLRPGVQLVVPPVDGVFFKIREMMTISELAEITQVDPFEIIESPYNPYLEGATPDSLLLEGLQIMVPNGNGGNCNIWEGKPSVNTSADSANIQNTIQFYSLWGCEAQIGGGSFPVGQPVANYQFFQGFSGYHTGVDLSASMGEPVRAAGGGTVIFAGWNDYGYGRTIVIAHGSTFTLYGHLNSIGVSCGGSVSQGQVIGEVGSSGNSSGPHLHFEIRNAAFDPVDPCYTIRC